MKQSETDVLIIGSGPVGATFARLIHESLPRVKIIMIDLGPKLSDKAGMHVKNIKNEREQVLAQVHSQGPHTTPYRLITVAERANAVNMGELSLELLARPGTYLIAENAKGLKKSGMPAAAISSNVGGMGAHWTCACPRPGNAEKISFIPEDEYERIFLKAEQLLSVTQNAFEKCAEGIAIQKVLGDIFNPALSKQRQVQPMPLAFLSPECGSWQLLHSRCPGGARLASLA